MGLLSRRYSSERNYSPLHSVRVVSNDDEINDNHIQQQDIYNTNDISNATPLHTNSYKQQIDNDVNSQQQQQFNSNNTVIDTYTPICTVPNVGSIHRGTNQYSQHGYIMQYNQSDNDDTTYTQNIKKRIQHMYITKPSDLLMPQNNFLFIRPSHIQPVTKNNFDNILQQAQQDINNGDNNNNKSSYDSTDEQELDEYYGNTDIDKPVLEPIMLEQYNTATTAMTTAEAVKTLLQSQQSYVEPNYDDIDDNSNKIKQSIQNVSEAEQSDNEQDNNNLNQVNNNNTNEQSTNDNDDENDDSDTDSVLEPIHCAVCVNDDLVDPWISPCGHVCCSDCWVNYLSNTGNKCPSCSRDIEVDQLKSVILCCICGQQAELPYTAKCNHTACKQCWIEELEIKQTCVVCDKPVLLTEVN